MKNSQLENLKKTNKRLKGIIIGLSALSAGAITTSIVVPLVISGKKGTDTTDTNTFAPTVEACKSATTLYAVEQSNVLFNKDVTLTTKIQYSTTGADNSWLEAEGGTRVSIPKGGCLYLKGDNENGLSNEDAYWNLNIYGKCNIGGSAMGLLDDGKATMTSIPSNYCFQQLFSSSSGLNKVYSNFLPADELKQQCYYAMFRECHSLINAPKLPATTLANNCYCEMFYSCTSLTEIPELPATTLAESCYQNMFDSCTKLTTAPNLPATTLADNCYNSMFYDCASLKNAPKISAENLAVSCCYSMFYHCYNLTIAPDLSATTLVANCYQNMFDGCTNLIKAPSLPAKTLAENCYNCMFYECYSLENFPELPTAETLADNCYYGMFTYCSSLKINEGDPTSFATKGKVFSCPKWDDVDKYAQKMFEYTGGSFYKEENDGTPIPEKDYYWYTE